MTQDNISSTISAPGRHITLANGNEITIRYGLGAIVEIETHYGSINALAELLNQGEKGPMFTTLAHALWAGTSRKMPLPAFLDLLSPTRIPEYTLAFTEALSEALGTSKEASPGEAEAAPAA